MSATGIRANTKLEARRSELLALLSGDQAKAALQRREHWSVALMTHDPETATRPSKTELVALSDRVDQLRRQAQGRVTPIALTRVPETPRRYRAQVTAPYDWIVVRAVDDPLYRDRRLGIPKAERRKIAALHNDGVEFDDLLVAHEIDKAAVIPEVPKADELHRWIKPAVDPVTTTIIDKTTKVVRGAAIAIGATAAAVVASPLLLVAAVAPDPILFGLLTLDGSPLPGTPCVLFEIARW
jgi:hypothetical protein